jgi:hyperosmotically inducible periplasmic protein
LKRSISYLMGLLALALILAPASTFAAVDVRKPANSLEKRIRHELVMLPYYGIFDNLDYRIDPNGHLTLVGQVVQPTLKSDAENVVRRVEGVTSVSNQIEVLPPSPFDDQTRRAVARAIFSYGSLSRYSWGPIPPLHIIVNGGHVTLEGKVANEMDKNVANIRANGVSGVFSVTNNLVVDGRG